MSSDKRKAARLAWLAKSKKPELPTGKAALHPHLRQIVKAPVLNGKPGYEDHGKMISAKEFWFGKADAD